MSNPQHVAIVGAGFGGLGVAEQLGHVPVEVTLIDRHNYHTFQPLLYQVATSLLNAEDVGAPVRSMFRHQENVTFRMATVTAIDAAGQNIQLEDGQKISYDYLVLAGGATVNYFNTPGAAEHAFPLYTLTNAVKLRNRILERFEAADRDPVLIDDGALNFVIVGAGPTGVETAGALSDLFYNLLPRDYHDLATEKARVMIVEMGKEVLAPFKDNLRAYAKAELEQRRVEVRLGEAVDVSSGLKKALQHSGPALIDIVTDPNAVSLPSHITAEQVVGFGLTMGKLVLSGHIDEVVDTIEANIRHI